MPVDVPAEAYPLAWPDGWTRTEPHKRSRAAFKVTEATARDHLVDQVRLLGGRNLVLSTNVAFRRDGLPYANQKTPEDPGVAVYWLNPKNQWRVVACDRWSTVGDNLRAIGRTLEAIRGLDRWGASDMLDRVFSGFAALPAAATASSWQTTLGLTADATLADAEAAYRALAKVAHPDRGGSDEQMAIINDAIRSARQQLKGGA